MPIDLKIKATVDAASASADKERSDYAEAVAASIKGTPATAADLEAAAASTLKGVAPVGEPDEDDKVAAVVTPVPESQWSVPAQECNC